MLGLIRTILIILGLMVVYQFVSKLIYSSKSVENSGRNTGTNRRAAGKKDNPRDDGEYIEYEEIK